VGAGHPRVRFLGHLGEPKLSGLFRNAEAELLPSLCHEVFPLVMLEAFRQRTPVVARRVGEMSEAVETSGNGFAYTTEGELDAAIAALAGDPARRARMGEAGDAAFEARWTPDAHIERYLAIIAELKETAPRHRASGTAPGGAPVSGRARDSAPRSRCFTRSETDGGGRSRLPS
jgi:glycosyltransferase involved in cell wall biosynthesis